MEVDFGFEPFDGEDYYFISYAHADVEQIQSIVLDLHQQGIPLWYDKGIKTGETWRNYISNKITNCCAVILFLTKDVLYNEESYVIVEYDAAKKIRKKRYVVSFIENEDIPSNRVLLVSEMTQKQTIQHQNVNGTVKTLLRDLSPDKSAPQVHEECEPDRMEPILKACRQWVKVAKKSGRLEDYSATEEQAAVVHDLSMAQVGRENAGPGCTLKEMLFQNDDVPNLMLTAAGGSGKTFLLFELASKLLAEDVSGKMAQYVPLYVPLDKLDGAETGIFDYCRKSFAEHGSGINTEKVFRGECGRKPLLLLDGFNEISSVQVQNQVIRDISDFRRRYPQARYVVTSRYDFASSFDGQGSVPFIRVELLELKDEQVISYLEKRLELDKEKAQMLWKEQPPKMKKTLRRPMALSLYVQTRKHLLSDTYRPDTYRFETCNRLAELLANYNYLLLKNIQGQQDHDTFVTQCKKTLAYIGFRMVCLPTFNVDRSTLLQWIRASLDSGEQIKASTVLQELEKTVLRKQPGDLYRFAHQNLRDYHCASYLDSGMTEIQNGAWDRCSEFFPQVFSDEILTLFGELIQDYTNDSTRIGDAIAVLKNHQSDNAVQRVILQLIQTARLVREDLHGFDFSGLDLSMVSLNGCKLYQDNGHSDVRSVAKFENTTVSDVTFAPQGHANAVFAMCLVQDRFLLSFSQHTVCCYAVETGTYTTIGRFTGYKPTAAAYLGNDLIAVGDESNQLYIHRCAVQGAGAAMRVRLVTCVSLDFPDSVNRIQAVSERQFYVSVRNGSVYLLQRNDQSYMAQQIYHPKPQEQEAYPVCAIAYSEEKKKTKYRKTIVKTLYIAYGPKIYSLDLSENRENEWFCVPVPEGERLWIFDICIVQKGLLVYYKTLTQNKVILVPHEQRESWVPCGLDEDTKNHFHGYSKFHRSRTGEVFICRNDQNPEKPNAYQLLVSGGPEPICVDVKPFSMGVQQLRVVESILLPDRKKLATCSVDRSIQILDIGGNEPTVCFKGNNNGIHEVFLDDDDTLFCAQYSGEVSMWQREQGKWYCTRVYPIHSNWVWSVEGYEVNKKNYLLTASYDHTVKLTDVLRETCVMTVQLDDKVLSARVCSKDNRILAHTHSCLWQLSVDYSGDEPVCFRQKKLYEAKSGEYIRDISVGDEAVFAAVNSNITPYHSVLLRIGLESEKTGVLAVIAPDAQDLAAGIQQYVIRCIHRQGQLLAVGGDVKYQNKGQTTGFCTIVSLETPELHLERYILEDPVSCVHLCASGHLRAVSAKGNHFCINPEKLDTIEGHHIANTQLLDIRAQEDFVYIASLDGCVYQFSMGCSNAEAGRAAPILETVSGFQMCGIQLDKAIKSGNYSLIQDRISRYISDDASNNVFL